MRRGFTLVEIMIVVAIIALLAAIAIPNLLRARHNANETAGIAALRTISTASESYRAAQTPPEYPDALTDLSGATPPYLDASISSATGTNASRQGYYFTYTGGTNTYNCLATPASSGVTGTRIFYVDQSGVIRLNAANGTAIQ